MDAPLLEVPTPPRPKRLNRLALVAVVVVLGVALGAVLLTLRPPQAKAPREAAEPAAAEPAFLDRAPAAPPAGRPVPPAAEPSYWEQALREAQAAGAARAAAGGEAEGGLGAVGVPGQERPAAPGPSPREEAFRRALIAPVAPSARPAESRVEEEGSAQHLSLPPFVPAVVPGLPEAGTGRPAAPAAAPTAAGRADHEAFLHGSEALIPTELPVRRDPGAGGGYVLEAGTVIPAALLTAVNSDLAGPLVAQVTQDVFDRGQRRVLIPRGSRLLGEYDNRIAVGESRLLVAWSRVIFPSGSGLSFPGLPAATKAGEAGLSGSVDNHLARVFGSAILLSIVSAGAQLSQPQESATFGGAPSTRQVAAAAVGQELSEVGIELLRRQMAVQPTIRIASGTSFYVFLKGDVALDPYSE
jgi:type IV secretory pathway VirB10-like protein